MKDTLIAVALVIAMLFGLKAFTSAVAKPVERSAVPVADGEYLVPADDIGQQAREPQFLESLLQGVGAKPKASLTEHTLHLRGVILGQRPLIIVNHATLAPGETADISLAGRNVTVRCLKVDAQSAQVLVNGKEATLHLVSQNGA